MKLLIPIDFQKRAFYRLLYLSEILPNEQISRDFLLDIKRATFDGK